MRQEFTANVSHELKTPLAAISGYSELIASGMAREDAKRFSEEIHKSADRLLTLINNDVIRLSELDAQGVSRTEETVELGCCAGVRRPFGLFCRKARRRHCGAGRGCLCARGPGATRKSSSTISDNAVRYNKEHGSVTVTVENTPGRRAPVCATRASAC